MRCRVRFTRLSPPATGGSRLVALWSLVFIVVTGAAVRLTGSGLGCTRLADLRGRPGGRAARVPRHGRVREPHDHRAGVGGGDRWRCSARCAGCPAGATSRGSSLGLVAGVIGQIVLGGLVVHVRPEPVAGPGPLRRCRWCWCSTPSSSHHRAGLPDDGRPVRPVVEPTAAAARPAPGRPGGGRAAHRHGGHRRRPARRAERRPGRAAAAGRRSTTRPASTASRCWSSWPSPWSLLVRLRRSGADAGGAPAAARRCSPCSSLQGAIGYTQYFTGVPPLLVGLHVLGAVAGVAGGRCDLLLELTAPLPRSAQNRPHVDRVADHPTGRDLVAHG